MPPVRYSTTKRSTVERATSTNWAVCSRVAPQCNSHKAHIFVQFIVAAERQLKPGERLPMSTEILESTFALYKQLERQHSKGGFTSLLAGFAALLRTSTPESIRKSFSTTTLNDVKRWVKENLGDTLTTKRRITYNGFRQAVKRATIQPATC